MLFDQYSESDYVDAKNEIQKTFPSDNFINALNINIKYQEIEDYIEDRERRVPKSVIQLIATYCKRWAKLWKCNIQFDCNIQNQETVTHTIILIDYLDEWHLAIHENSSNIMYNYAISLTSQRMIKEKCHQYSIINGIKNIIQEPISYESDTIAMIKVLSTIMRMQNLQPNIPISDIKEWQSWNRLIDLFLFSLHNKQNEFQNQSNSQSYLAKSSSFRPDISQHSSIKSLEFENSLQRSLKRHIIKSPNLDQEMISLSKAEFIYMMDRFKQDVAKELQKVDQTDPSKFLESQLDQFGKLKSTKMAGKVEYYVQMDRESLQRLLAKYETYYQEQQYKQQYEEARLKAQEQYQYFLQFQQLLNYYYQTNPTKYAELVQEYNQKLNQKLIDQVSHKDLNQQQQLSQQQQQQQQQQSKVLEISQAQSNNKQFLSQSRQSKIQQSQMMQQSSINNHSNISLGQKQEYKQNIIASRYNKSIGLAEIQLLENTYQCSENMLNFFIRYLDEKQQSRPEATLKQLQVRTLFLTTTFYKALSSNNNNPNQLDYQQASFYTKQFIGKNNTIFDRFDLILIPIVISSRESTLIQINLRTKIITYFDSMLNGDGAKSMASSQLAQTGLLTNPYLLSCLRFIEMEHNEKMMKSINLLQWQIYYSAHEKSVDFRQSNLLIGLLMHQLCNGKRVNSNGDSLKRFLRELDTLIKQIGITQNKKNELNFESMII